MPICLDDVSSQLVGVEPDFFLYSSPHRQAHRLPLLVSAFRASQKMLLRGNATPELLEGFEEEMQLALDEEVTFATCFS